ncbi:MAG: OmpA family protein [Treponema sp.]|jgi:outer membrane protein OmpA-like peptidoglycan-associated protein|nr:OmpA family protein [Treponema sp.]
MGLVLAGYGKRIILLALVLFSLTVPVFSQQKNSLSLGIFPEANANTRKGYGLAGGLIADYGITGRIAAGLKADFGSDFYDVTSLEALAFGRYYFLGDPLPFPLFVQAGAGVVMLLEEDRSVLSVLGDGAVGIRFPIKNFYTEQYVRFGWPHGFGFGLVIGYRFGKKPAPPKAPETGPEVTMPEEPAETVPEAAPPEAVHEEEAVPEGLEIIFRSNVPDFHDDRAEWEPIFKHNMYVLYTVADFLKAHPEYTVHITGHANPVLGTEEENSGKLIPLSVERAEFVRNELVHLGIDAARLSVSGAGGAEARQEDPQRNRRAEFRFEKTGE